MALYDKLYKKGGVILRDYVCFNCGYSSLFKNSLCPVCNRAFKKLSFMEQKKFSKLTRKETILWIENKIGHKIPEELNLKREEYIAQWLKNHPKPATAIDIAVSKAHSAARATAKSGGVTSVKCPYCNSISVKKIGVGSRMVSTSVFGLSSSKIGKQWHCNHCNSDF